MFQVQCTMFNGQCSRYSRSPARPSSPPGGLEAPSSSDEEKVKYKMQLCQDKRRLKREFMFSCGVSLIEIHVFTFLLFAQKAWLSLITLTDKVKMILFTPKFNWKTFWKLPSSIIDLEIVTLLLMHVNMFSKYLNENAPKSDWSVFIWAALAKLFRPNKKQTNKQKANKKTNKQKASKQTNKKTLPKLFRTKNKFSSFSSCHHCKPSIKSQRGRWSITASQRAVKICKLPFSVPCFVPLKIIIFTSPSPRPRTTILTPKTPVCGLLHGD